MITALPALIASCFSLGAHAPAISASEHVPAVKIAVVAHDSGDADERASEVESLPRPDGAPEDWSTWRVAGDLFAKPERLDDESTNTWRYRDMVIDTKLPAGYPAPTPPGAVEIKRYPSVRRAEISSAGDPQRGSRSGFFPLFRHIQRNDIAMTSPVEMDLHLPDDAEDVADAAPVGWTMSFLYETTDLGPTGTDSRDRRVLVKDTEPVVVIAVGVRGSDIGLEELESRLALLTEWLDGNTGWSVAGEPRVFGYNGPMTPRDRRWSEVQLPIERTDAGSDSSEAAGAEARLHTH